MRRPLGWTAVAALALVFALQPAWAQRPPPELPVYGHTLMNGTGYIATPHAFVSRGALFGTATFIAPDAANFDSYTVTRFSGGLALGGFIEAGATIGYVDAFTFFGKLQAVRQTGIFPAIAVGIANLTTADIGRHGIEDLFYDDPQDASSLYAVFTYVVGPGRTSFPSFVTVSGGWGTGIFMKENPQIEGSDRSGGIFGAVTFDFQAGEDAYLRAITEWDGHDLNLGATAWLAGLELTVGVLAVGKGEAEPRLEAGEPFDPTRTFPGQYYNQVKPFVSMTLDFRALGAIPWVWTKDEE
jgi:hypothetical protein